MYGTIQQMHGFIRQMYDIIHGLCKNVKIKFSDFFPFCSVNLCSTYIKFFILYGGPKVGKSAHCSVHSVQEIVQTNSDVVIHEFDRSTMLRKIHTNILTFSY